MRKIGLRTKFKVRLENEVLKEIITDNNCCTPEEFQRGEDFANRVTDILIKTLQEMHFKKKIRNRIYGLYLNGVSLESIAFQTDMTDKDVDYIIDYMNEIYN